MAKKEEKLVSLNGLSVDELLKKVQEKGYYVARTPLERRGQTFKGDLKRWSGPSYRFGVVADTQLGSRYQQLTHLYTFYSIIARRRINTVFHCGDLVDGEKIYRGQEYEIFCHGADAQRDYAIAHYPKRKSVSTFIISGNHDQSFHKVAGYNIVKAICQQRGDMVYLGDDVAFYELGNLPVRIMLMHARGGVPYARSYRMQKIVEQLAGGTKPHFLFMGHLHVMDLMQYRNVQAVTMPCFQGQTPYLAAKGLNPEVGGLIVTFQVDKIGLAKVVFEWIPFYRHKKNDF